MIPNGRGEGVSVLASYYLEDKQVANAGKQVSEGDDRRFQTKLLNCLRPDT